jgi:hypothetical protein
MVRIMRFQRPAPYSRSIATLIACAWMALSSAIHSSPSHAGGDVEEIQVLIGKTWNKPDSKVETDPVVISGGYAVASWTQGGHGGRALLRRGETGWKIVLCSGDPLTKAAWLAEAGVPPQDAGRIAADLAVAEALASEARRKKFSLFEGIVEADDPAHGAHTHHDHKH